MDSHVRANRRADEEKEKPKRQRRFLFGNGLPLARHPNRSVYARLCHRALFGLVRTCSRTIRRQPALSAAERIHGRTSWKKGRASGATLMLQAGSCRSRKVFGATSNSVSCIGRRQGGDGNETCNADLCCRCFRAY